MLPITGETIEQEKLWLIYFPCSLCLRFNIVGSGGRTIWKSNNEFGRIHGTALSSKKIANPKLRRWAHFFGQYLLLSSFRIPWMFAEKL
jgi:hypothetical protein